MNRIQKLEAEIQKLKKQEAAKINKCIEDEYNKLKNRKHESK